MHSIQNLFPRPSSQREYHESDGFRGLAILLVFGFHYFNFFVLKETEFPTSNIFISILYSGAAGVQLFFVLSAYLLFRPQYERLIAEKPQTSISLFLWRRFFRIAPLYYAGLVSVCLFENYYLKIENFNHILAHLLFLHNFYQKTEYSIIDVAWSLGIEFIFYFALIIFTTLLFKLRILKYNKIAYLILFSLVSAIVIKSIYQSNFVPPISSFSFLCGIVAAVIATHLNSNKKLFLTLIGISTIIALIFLHWQISSREHQYFHHEFISKLVYMSLCYATLIVIASKNDYILYPTLSWLPLRIVGLFSYEIYLIHSFAISIFSIRLFLFTQIQEISNLLSGLYLFFILIIVGGILHFLISRPFMKIPSYIAGDKVASPMPYLLNILLIILVMITLTPFIFLLNQY